MTRPENRSDSSGESLRPQPASSPTLDDAEIGRLVHTIVDGWSMPPVRLDQPGWRERVRSPRARRAAAVESWTGRLGRAAAAALVLTVGAAMLGVWLTRPLGPASETARPSATDRASSSPGLGPDPGPSQLPKLVIDGDLPSPSSLVVNVEGGFSVVDLARGTIGNSIAAGQYGTEVRRSPDGSLYCLCLGGDTFESGSFTHVTVTWTPLDEAGPVGPSVPVGDFTGVPDPRDAGNAQQAQHVAMRVSYGPDPGIAFVGWAAKDRETWLSGLLVVDIADGSVLQRFDLPVADDGSDTVRRGLDAPRVVGSLDAGRLAVARPWYTWSPPASQNPSYLSGADLYAVERDGGTLLGAQPVTAATGCADGATAAGPRASGGYWIGCIGYQSLVTIVRRVAADGSVVGDTRMRSAGDLGDPNATIAATADGTAVLQWNPTAKVLTRVDVETGDTTVGTGDATATRDVGPLAWLGRWLTPTASAKVLLSSALAVSPDGTRAYALGIDVSTSCCDFGTSAGVFVFDTSTMTQVGHWTPTADFVSIAVSGDGRFVYAAGSPQFDGGARILQESSVTVFDATNGSVRLLAGQLGRGFLLLPTTTVR